MREETKILLIETTMQSDIGKVFSKDITLFRRILKWNSYMTIMNPQSNKIHNLTISKKIEIPSWES